MDQQTTSSFTSYSQNDVIEIDDTENVNDLIKKLLSDERTVIVTTIQKLNHVMRRYKGKEAIKDNAVLGFQIEYKSTFSEEELEDAINKYLGNNCPDLDSMEVIEKESYLPKAVYEEEEHMLQVIHSIVNKSRHKLGFKHGVGRTYQAILTTSSIEQAQRYYDLIKKVKAGESTVRISEETKRVLPDFPKIAITYSISENEEDSSLNQDKMKESIRDYNEEFGTSYTLENIRAYNNDVNGRLARKSDRYNARFEQLDLVIVVNRLLTGFDAPSLSTLFIDRSPMQPHDLIQAFSRTNRLLEKSKKYGQIVAFQMPKTFGERVNEALVLYSNGGENEILAPVWEVAKEDFLNAIKNLREIAATPEEIEFDNESFLKRFAKAYQGLDRTFSSIQVYGEFEEKQLGTIFPIIFEEIENYLGKYNNALEVLRNLRKENGIPPEPTEIDIEYELESIKTEEINYEYILTLIQSFVPSKGEELEVGSYEDNKIVKEIREYIDDLREVNLNLGILVEELWENIQKNPEEYRDKNVSVLLENMIQSTKYELIEDFSQKWCVNEANLDYVVSNYNPSRKRQNGEAELKNTSNYDKYKEICVNPVSKLKYWKNVRQDLKELVETEILPLRKR